MRKREVVSFSLAVHIAEWQGQFYRFCTPCLGPKSHTPRNNNESDLATSQLLTARLVTVQHSSKDMTVKSRQEISFVPDNSRCGDQSIKF